MLILYARKGTPIKPTSELLSSNEIIQIVQCFTYYGMNNIQLTGVEPTLRNDLMDIVSQIHKVQVQNIINIIWVSNGIILHRIVKELNMAGITSINISLDTLCYQYPTITPAQVLYHIMVVYYLMDKNQSVQVLRVLPVVVQHYNHYRQYQIHYQRMYMENIPCLFNNHYKERI